MAVLSSGDAAVRSYLMFLDDPSQLVDNERIADLERQVSDTTDPLERLRIFGQIEALRHPDEAPYREAFITHAKEWAASNRVPAPAFVRMGVPKRVLEAAGLRTNAAASAESPATRAGGPTRRIVRADEIAAHVADQPGAFTLQSLQADTGASPMTVRKAVERLMANGRVRCAGPDPSWSKAGRAPNVYESVAVSTGRRSSRRRPDPAL